MMGLGAPLPKPMLPIGSRPVLWHVMKLYAASGYTDFVLALGYLGNVIKEYFLHYEALASDFTVEIGSLDGIQYHGKPPEAGWRVTCIDTGLDSSTGTRVYAASRGLGDGPVLVTYGDGVADIDISALLAFHRSHGKLATVTAVHPPGRFGELQIGDAGEVFAFEEKPQTSTGAINGGFLVLERSAIDAYIPSDDDVMLEREPLARLAADGELAAYRHTGFWQPMDTPREHELLTTLWDSGKAPWKRWD
jgi:glucose-1-phosphate cytidylyltransferase